MVAVHCHRAFIKLSHQVSRMAFYVKPFWKALT